MKYIQPIEIWIDGNIVKGTILNIFVIYDNLNDSATFYYALYSGTLEEIGQKLTDSNITMTPEDYKNWQDDTTLYDWISKTLSITFL